MQCVESVNTTFVTAVLGAEVFGSSAGSPSSTANHSHGFVTYSPGWSLYIPTIRQAAALSVRHQTPST